MNKFQVFIDENKDILNDFAKKYIEKTDMPELLKKSISYSLVNDGKKIRPLSFLYLLKYYFLVFNNTSLIYFVGLFNWISVLYTIFYKDGNLSLQ